MHRTTARILDVSNAFHNKNLPIHERVYFSPPHYYLDWLERSYTNVSLNFENGPFCIQCMDGIQATKPSGIKYNTLLDAVVTIITYKKITIDQDIYIKVFTDGIVSYLTVFTDDVFNTTTNETSFPELTRVFKEHFEMKVEEGSYIKYLKFLV